MPPMLLVLLVLVHIASGGRPAGTGYGDSERASAKALSVDVSEHFDGEDLRLASSLAMTRLHSADTDPNRPGGVGTEDRSEEAPDSGSPDDGTDAPDDKEDDESDAADANQTAACEMCQDPSDGDDPDDHEGWLQASKVEHQVEATVANLVVCFLVFNMMILILVSFPDAEVQRSSLTMLSMCIAIFCAVLFEHGHLGLVREFAAYYLLPEGVSQYVLIYAVDFPLLLFWFFFTSFAAHSQRDNPIRLHAVTMVFSHITAFIAIGLFRNVPDSLSMQISKDDEYFNPWVVQVYIMCITAAIAIFWSGTLLARKVSVMLTANPHKEPHLGEVADSEGHGHEGHGHEEDAWIEHVWEEEVEASALVLAFLVRNCICTIFIFSANPMQLRFLNMGISLFLLIGAMCGLATVRVIVMKLHLDENKHLAWIGDILMYFETICIMSVGWLVISYTRHGMQYWFAIYPHLRYIYTTLALSPICLTSLAIIGGLRRCHIMSDKVVRCVESALGLVVGFSWEKALKEAIHHVVHEVSHHQIGQKVGDAATEALICCGLGGFMMIVWGMFLVPRLVNEHGHALTDDHAMERDRLADLASAEETSHH